MDSFCKSLNLPNSGNEEDVILESYSKDERARMALFDDSEDEFFYMYLIIRDLGVLIPS